MCPSTYQWCWSENGWDLQVSWHKPTICPDPTILKLLLRNHTDASTSSEDPGNSARLQLLLPSSTDAPYKASYEEASQHGLAVALTRTMIHCKELWMQSCPSRKSPTTLTLQVPWESTQHNHRHSCSGHYLFYPPLVEKCTKVSKHISLDPATASSPIYHTHEWISHKARKHSLVKSITLSQQL